MIYFLPDDNKYNIFRYSKVNVFSETIIFNLFNFSKNLKIKK